jgi:hypothetical protein
MHKLLILFLILVAVFFMFMKKPTGKPMDDASGTGPGYIPAFQGHPQIGVRT